MWSAPVVSKKAVHDFLYGRRLRDSDKVKRFTRRALLRKARALGLSKRLWRLVKRCRTHQLASFLLGAGYPEYLFLLDMGLGKTYLDLLLFAYWRHKGLCKKAIVLVPNTTNVGGWLDEVAKHTPHLKAVGLDGDRADRLEAMDADADLVIMTYMGFLSLVCPKKKDCAECNATGKVPGKRKHKKCRKCKGRGWVHLKLRVDPKLFRQYMRGFDMAILDEVTAAANPRSVTHRACLKLTRQCKAKYGLTGTPFGRDPQTLWGMFYLFDEGETLGQTLGLFRNALFTASKNFWSGGYEYTFDKRKTRLLRAMLRHRSIRYSEAECQDLPRLVPTVMPVRLPSETRVYYEKLIQAIQEAKGNRTLIENTFIRMRQLASGYLTVKDDQGRMDVRFAKNPKLEAIVDNVLSMPPGRKAIIFHEYKVSGELVCEGLKRAKVKYKWLHGGMGRRGREAVEAFLRQKKYQVLVSSSAGAYGGNWQAANYVHFYESPTNPMLRRQEEKRAHRDGQTRTVFQYDYPVLGTVEVKILEYLREGKDLFEALIEGKVQP
jgi:SNF2 family DNA or RNA helicase